MFLVRDKDVIVVGLGGGTEQIQELGRSAGITHMTYQPLEERQRNMRLGHLPENFRHADYFLFFRNFRNRFVSTHFSFVGAFTTRRHWQRSWWNNNDGDLKWGGWTLFAKEKWKERRCCFDFCEATIGSKEKGLSKVQDVRR